MKIKNNILRYVIYVTCITIFYPLTTGVVKAVSEKDLAIIINDRDPLSIQIGAYYQKKRHIPARNIVRISFIPGRSTISADEFNRLKEDIDKRVSSTVQAYVLAWVLPYRVDCMSITTAFAAGYNQAFCSRKCSHTQKSPYFNSASHNPFTDYGWRPTMMLAAKSFEQAKSLIDRGVISDGTNPNGTAWLLNTSDKARNVRSVYYSRIFDQLAGRLNIRQIRANLLKNKKNILFYFTGITKVAELGSNTFVPGAIADHLTSAGGVLDGSTQMSSLRWLEAGATGSYGAVVEPCNILAKFPHPGMVIDRYLQGETLIEAYWKSVAQPGQGVFIGEPLARPFGDKNFNKIK